MSTVAELEQQWLKNDYAPRTSDGKVIARKNLVLNPCGVVNISNWATIGSNNAALATVNDPANGSGISNYFVRKTNALDGDPALGFGSSSNSVPVGTYTASFYVRASRAQTFYVYLEGTATKSQYSGPNVALAANTWARLSLTFNVTVAGTVKVGGYGTAPTVAGETVDITGVMLEQVSSTGRYFDGNSTDDNWTDYRWEGTANASASLAVEPEPVVAENLAYFPDVWTGFLTYPATRTSEYVEAQFKVGGASQGIFQNNGFPALPGQRLYLKAIVESISGTHDIKIQTGVKDSSNAYISGLSTTVVDAPTFIVSPDQGRTIIYAVYDVPNDPRVVKVEPVIRRLSNPSVDTDVLRVWGVTMATKDSPVFNGYTPNAVWRGSPEHSGSVLIDINARDNGYLENSYWSKRSGLSVGSSADHERAALLTLTGLTSGTVADLRKAYFMSGSGLPAEATIADHELAFYKNQLGVA